MIGSEGGRFSWMGQLELWIFTNGLLLGSFNQRFWFMIDDFLVRGAEAELALLQIKNLF